MMRNQQTVQSRKDRSPLGSRTEVAEYLGIPPSTLAYWACRGIGPRYVKVGRAARYAWADVDAWVDARARAGDQGAA